MRISGIASGFDTDEMVKNLMKVERMKVDKYEQNKQTTLWRQESYNSMNKLFANFILNTKKDIGLKHTSSTGTILDSSYKSLSYVKRATSSNESAATVRSTNKAVNGSYTIDVKKLATNASLSSTKIEANETFGKELKITLKTDKKNEDGTSIEKEITVENAAGVTMDDIAKAINSSKVRILDGKQISDEIYEGLESDKKKLVKEELLGINAFYQTDNSGKGTLFMQTTGTGEKAEIELSATGDESTNFMEKMGSNDGVVAVNKKGTDAIIEFNGVELTYDSNNINLNGIDIELKTEGVSTTINVNTNVDGIMEKVEKLIADYNELVDVASKLLEEKKYSNYKPLSSEERKAMTEEDLKLWDEKSKSGMLNGDETIQRTLQAMRNDLYRTVEGLEGQFSHITQLGISTEKYSKGGAGGKLQIDTEKLRAAIEEDPEGVMELLFEEPGKLDRDLSIYPKDDAGNRAYESALKKHNKENSGLFTNVYENIIDGMKSIIDKSGPGEDAELFRGVKSNMLIDFVTKKSSISDLDKSVLDMNRQIDNLNILLAKKEDSYYAKFTAMEKYMYQMNSQSGWLAQQFG